MNRLVTAFALALSLASTSAVALADTGKAPAARHERGDRPDRAEFEKQFPMPAAQFQQKAVELGAKAREHMEKRLTEKQVPADKANEIRANFNATAAKVQAKIAEVTTDGTVTLDEAKSVMAVAREGRPQHPHGERGKAPRQGQK